MTTKVGNEIDHLGAVILEQDFCVETQRRAFVRNLKFVGEFVLFAAFVAVVLLLAIALS